jgi:IclR family pca regulon transcriptional regulator
LGRVLLAGQDEQWREDYLAAVPPFSITRKTIADAATLRSELGRIRARGFAIVDQELEDGLRAVAAPVRDRDGQVVAAVNVAVHTSGWTLTAIRSELAPRLLVAASAIERDLAAMPSRRASRPASRTALPEAESPREDATRGGDRETEFIQSLKRGLEVIRAFDAGKTTLTLTDVAKAAGLPRAAARRFLLTLVELDYMRIDGRLFRLTPRVLEFGRPHLASLTISQLALPHLRDLVAEVGESSTVATLDGMDIIYVSHVPAKRVLSVSVQVGTRDPAFATSLGRALLAGQSDQWLDGYLRAVRLPTITPKTIVSPQALKTELARVRRQGVALVDQELEEGLRAVAVPIRDGNRRVVAAINLAVPAKRRSLGSIRSELVPRLLETAAAIERDIGASWAGFDGGEPV